MATKKKASTKKKTSAKTSAGQASHERYKVSPLRGMPVATWIDTKTNGWQRDVIRRLVEVVQRAAPEASCEIKWAQPVFEQNGPFAFIKPAKAHVSVGFWRGSEIADPKGLLERGEHMGHFKLRGPDELDERALAAMVKDAVRLNREKGRPTMR